MNIQDYETIFDYRGDSYNKATNKYPYARHFERQALLDLLHVEDQFHILDVPSGGGYFAFGAREQFGPDIRLTCIEPVASFSEESETLFPVINSSIDQIPLPDHSVDVIASLAGLHHIENREDVFSEWRRLLKYDGQVAVADVREGSGPAKFLNIFVDQYTPQGHKGIFFPEGEFSGHLSKLGFDRVEEKSVVVPWYFDRLEDMAEFCSDLFYLCDVDKQEVLDALDHYVGIRTADDGTVAVNWELSYAFGIKR